MPKHLATSLSQKCLLKQPARKPQEAVASRLSVDVKLPNRYRGPIVSQHAPPCPSDHSSPSPPLDRLGKHLTTIPRPRDYALHMFEAYRFANSRIVCAWMICFQASASAFSFLRDCPANVRFARSAVTNHHFDEASYSRWATRYRS